MILLNGQGGGDFSGMLIMMGGMFVIMYFFMIRPQMKKAKEAKKFQESIAIGDKVMTLGGIHGKVLEVDETTVVIGLDQGRMRVEKAGLAADKRVAIEAEQK
ncbi:MAG: preprotein translocase subunit YajC [Bacteroidetes bacterium]|nr:preprotein translocase subunit YajC [Bacteroidota bacterium]